MSFQLHEDTVDGLRIVTVETPHLHNAFIGVFVRTGSRHEQPRTSGVSHFLEHLFFRGSAGYPDSVKMNAAVEDVGGNLNGATARDHGLYDTVIHPPHVHVGLKVLGDMLTRPLLRELDIERQVILEEILDEVDERGRQIDLDNLSKDAMFGAHPLGAPIAGNRKTVASISERQIREHFEQHYVRENMLVAVAGKVYHSEVLAHVEQFFAGLPHGSTSSEKPPSRAPKGPHFHYVQHDDAQTAFRLTFPTVPRPHPDSIPLDLLRRVLDGGLSSRLPFRVVERRGLAYSISASMELFTDAGLFDVEAASAPEKAAQVVDEVLAVLEEVRQDGVTDEELERARRRYRMFLETSQDYPADLATWFGLNWLFDHRESLEQRLELVERVTLDDLQRVARGYLGRDNLITVGVGQRKGRAALERAARAEALGRTGRR